MPSNEAEDRLSAFRNERETLAARYDGEIRFLREYAPSLCSSEERFRIKQDIDDMRKKLVGLEAKIWKLEHPNGGFA